MQDAMEHLRHLLARQWHTAGRETPLDGLLLAVADGPSGILRSIYSRSFCVVLQLSFIHI